MGNSELIERARAEHRREAASAYHANVKIAAMVRLVGKGRSAYLWIGAKDGKDCVHASGPKSLRALAEAILREVKP